MMKSPTSSENTRHFPCLSDVLFSSADPDAHAPGRAIAPTAQRYYFRRARSAGEQGRNSEAPNEYRRKIPSYRHPCVGGRRGACDICRGKHGHPGRNDGRNLDAGVDGFSYTRRRWVAQGLGLARLGVAPGLASLLVGRVVLVARIAPQAADRASDPEWRSAFAVLRKSLRSKSTGYRVGTIAEDDKYGEHA
jgi:hypothetical protein